MNLKLRIALLVGVLFFACYMIRLLIKQKLNLKYTLTWLLMIVALVFAAVADKVVAKVATMLGFITPANFILVVAVLFTFLILGSLTAIVSHLNNRIFSLVQQVAILEKQVRDLENCEQTDKQGDV